MLRNDATSANGVSTAVAAQTLKYRLLMPPWTNHRYDVCSWVNVQYSAQPDAAVLVSANRSTSGIRLPSVLHGRLLLPFS